MFDRLLPKARHPLIYAGFYLVVAAVVVRIFIKLSFTSEAAAVVAGVGLFTLIAIARDSGRFVLSRRPLLYLGLQTAIVTALLSIEPSLDFLALLFVLLSLQAVLLLPDPTRYLWLAALTLLIAVIFFVNYEPG